MSDPVLPIDETLALAGVSRRTKRRKGSGIDAAVGLTLERDFTLASATALISLLDEHCRLLFFDGDHPQRSDPGLYCYLQRIGNQLHAQGANHGWSYPWITISDASAARWLWLCADYNRGRVYEGSVMSLGRARPIDEKRVAGTDQSRRNFNSWLTGRLAGP